MVNSMPISLLLIFFLHIKMLKGCPSRPHKHLPHSLTRIPINVHFHAIPFVYFFNWGGNFFVNAIGFCCTATQAMPFLPLLS